MVKNINVVPSGSIVDDDSARKDRNEAFGQALILDQLKQLKIRRNADKYMKLTGDPLAAEAFELAEGDQEKAQKYLALGHLSRNALVRPEDVSRGDVREFAKQHYEAEAGRSLTEEELARLDTNLQDKDTFNNIRAGIAQQQTEAGLAQIGQTYISKDKAGNDVVNRAALTDSNKALSKFNQSVQTSAIEANRVLNTTLPQVRKSIKSGNLPSGRQYNAAGTLGNNVRRTLINNPDVDSFLAAQKDFARGARATFGGRVTNFELRTYLDAFPALEQSADGRLLVLEGTEQYYQLASLEGKIAAEITEKYRRQNPSNRYGYPPNLQQQLAHALDQDPRARDIYRKYRASAAHIRALANEGKDKQARDGVNKMLGSYYHSVGDKKTEADVERLYETYKYLQGGAGKKSLSRKPVTTLDDGSRYRWVRKNNQLVVEKLK